MANDPTPTYDQLEALSRIASEAATGQFGTTLRIDARPVVMFRVEVTARDENEIDSDQQTHDHVALIDPLGRVTEWSKTPATVEIRRVVARAG